MAIFNCYVTRGYPKKKHQKWVQFLAWNARRLSCDFFVIQVECHRGDRNHQPADGTTTCYWNVLKIQPLYIYIYIYHFPRETMMDFLPHLCNMYVIYVNLSEGIWVKSVHPQKMDGLFWKQWILCVRWYLNFDPFLCKKFIPKWLWGSIFLFWCAYWRTTCTSMLPLWKITIF